MNGHVLRVLLAVVFLLGFSVLVLQDAKAANFTAQNVGSLTINASTLNYPINITVVNSDTSANITQVNVTLYGFTFTGTNSTTASNANFSNSSVTQLGWVNYTSDGFMAANGTSRNFMFSANVTSAPGSYNITINVTDTAGAYNATNITYTIVDNSSYLLTFYGLSPSNMSQSTSQMQNLSYVIGIANNGSSQEQYNLSVKNCNDTSQNGTGILNISNVTIASGQIFAVQLNVITSNAAGGNYSSCIMASHWDGSAMNTTFSVASAQNGVILNSSFYPDINASAVYWNTTQSGYPVSGSNMTYINATIWNSGHFNFTSNFTVYLFFDGIFVNNKTVDYTTLGNGTSLTFASGFNVSSIPTLANGMHPIIIQVDALNNVTESNETNNNYTYSLYVGYNVSVLAIIGQYGPNVTANRTVNVTVSVKYANGTPVTSLTKYNFTVYDIYSGSALDAWTQADSIFDSTFNSSMNNSGIYWFNITSYSVTNDDTKPGAHNLTISVWNNESNNIYSGNSTGSDYYYLIAPRMVVTVTPAGDTMDEVTNRTVVINITNTGTDTIYSVTVSISATSFSSYPTTCSLGSNTTLNTTHFLACSISVKAQNVTGDENGVVTVTASGNHSYPFGSANTTYTRIGSNSIYIYDKDVSTQGTTGNEGGAKAKSCTSDIQCGANESCVSNKCAAISCTGGEIVDHMCIPFVYKINITSYDSVLSAISGGGNLTKVTIKNTGSKTLTAKLEVTINNVTANVTPSSYSLGAGESYQFTVNFTVPNTTTIGGFPGTFKAYVSTSTSSYDKKDFTFIVLPKEETKSVINTSYQELSSVLSALIANLSQMKATGRYNQTVLSSIENLISAANSTLLQMKNAMNSDDYVSAQSLISQVNTSLNNAKAGIESALITGQAAGPFEYGMWFWVAVIVIIIFVLGFFLYMFYPSSHEGYHPEKGFAPTEVKKEGFATKVKRAFKRKKKEESPPASITSFAQSMAGSPKDEGGHYETFHYKEGYKKEKSYKYEYPSKWVRGFFQKLRRKRSKKPPQMHIDQFATPAVTEQETAETKG